MINYDSMSFRKYHTISELNKSINMLKGILLGINIDEKINSEEIIELRNWCLLYRQCADISPYCDIIPMVLKSIEDGVVTSEEMEDILWVCNNLQDESKYFNLITESIQVLQGIFYGIMADGTIEDSEIKGLKNWLNENEYLSGTYPYDEIYSLLLSILKDGKIDAEERDVLKVFFSDFIDMKNSYNLNEIEILELKKKVKIEGICATCPDLRMQGKSYCFTGASHKASRDDFASIVSEMGALFENNVTKKTDFLIIGGKGNPCWAFACYGRKVEKAMTLRKEGIPIVIVHENDFWDAIEDIKAGCCD